MSIYNKAWLTDQFEKKERIKYLFFWGHQPAKDGTLTSSCFSQWWVSRFTVDGITYATAEHWMMAEKARLFNDEEMLARILAAGSPAEAKKLGRAVNGFSADIWDAQKFDIVVKGNMHKFAQDKAMCDYLLNTHERVIVEASPRDQIWGIGLGASNPKAENPLQWRGQNLLGFALMEVRDRLKEKV